MQTTSEDRRFSAFVVEPTGYSPLQCAVCGCAPKAGTKAFEKNTGHPTLLCSVCVFTAVTAFEDLDRLHDGTPL